MKRFFSLLLACTLLLCLPVLAESASNYVGVWIENDGNGTLTVRTDGTSTMVYYDNTVTECHWALTEEGARFTDGMWLNSPMALLDENTLSVASGWMIFTREGFLPTTDQALLLGAVPVGEEGAPYLGMWTLTSLIMEGEPTDPALFGITLTIGFQASGLTVIDDGMEPYTTTWFVSYGSAVVDGDILILDENDQLVLGTGDGSMIFTRVPAPEEPAPVEDETPSAEEEPIPANEEETAAQPDPVPVGEEGDPFLGVWTLFSILIDGDPLDPGLFGMTMVLNFTEDGLVTVTDDLDTQTTTWHVADGAAMVEDSPLTLNEDGLLVLEDEEGTVMFFIHPDEESTDDAVSSDTDDMLALLELLALLEGMDDSLFDLPEHHQGYVGEWQLCYLMTGGLTGDPRSMGVTGTLVLDADYTGSLTGLADATGEWYEDVDGVIRFGESGMPMFLIDAEADGLGTYLQYGTEAGGCMIFHQDAQAVWTPGVYPLQTPGAAEADAPAASGGEILPGVKYVCTSYSAGGVTNDASILGAEYAILFREDGLADFTMGGFTMTDLGCTVAEDGTRTVYYVTNELPCVPTETGLDMDFFGIIYHMVPAE